MKTRTLNSPQDADDLIAAVTASANAALSKLSQLEASSASALHALWALKFSPFGCDPLEAESPLNLIEQLNQTFTYVATARAVKILYRIHPELGPYNVNLGTAAGFDIESTGANLQAEVFAAVNTSNNQKLANDLAKMARSEAQFRFVFFMCPGYKEGRQAKLEGASGVEVWSVGDAA